MAMILPGFAIEGHAQAKRPEPTLHIGDPAPPIRAAKWIKGAPISTFEHGTVYVVDFWGTWCGPCIAAMPHLSDFAGRYKGKVVVVGVSVKEAKNSLEKVENFVADKGDTMAYTVAADSDAQDVWNSWLAAAGQTAVPATFVVDQNGRLAWFGYPSRLDAVVPQILGGHWDLQAEAAATKKAQELMFVDGNDAVMRLNPFMSKRDYPGALVEVAKVIAERPELEYYPKVGHFTFYSLVATDPARALAFGQAWIAANRDQDQKPYTDIGDTVLWSTGRELPVTLLTFAAQCYEDALAAYPWGVDASDAHSKIAELRFRAKDVRGAIAMARQALAEATKKGVPAARIADLQKKLDTYLAASGG